MALDDASRRNSGPPGRPAPALPSQAAKKPAPPLPSKSAKPAPALPSQAAKPAPALPSQAAKPAPKVAPSVAPMPLPSAARAPVAPAKPSPARASVAPPAALAPAPVRPVSPRAAAPIAPKAPVPSYDDDDGDGMTMVRLPEGDLPPLRAAQAAPAPAMVDFSRTDEHGASDDDGDGATMVAALGSDGRVSFGGYPSPIGDTSPQAGPDPHGGAAFDGPDPFGNDATELSALPFVGRAPAPQAPVHARPAPAPMRPAPAPPPPMAARPAPAPPPPMAPVDRPSRRAPAYEPLQRTPDFDARPPQPMRSVPPSPFDSRASERPPKNPEFLTSAASQVLPDAYREERRRGADLFAPPPEPRGFEPPPQRPRAPSMPPEYRPSFHPEFEPFELEDAKSGANPAANVALRPQPIPRMDVAPASVGPRMGETGEVWRPAGSSIAPTAPQDVAAFKQQVKGQVNLLYIVIGVLAAIAAVVVVGIIVLGARGAPENPSTIVPLDTGK